MKILKLFTLIFSLLLLATGDIFAQEIWINNTPSALVKRIEIYHNDNGILPDNPLLPTEGYLNITFQNDVEYTGLALHPIAGSITPSFLLSAVSDYSSFTVYYCQAASSPLNTQACDGIALRLVNGQLCAGYFRYTTLMDRVVTIADIGCFTREGIISPPRFRKDFLQRYTKEQLIDIINGVRPINPHGPFCTSCPPWDGYEKDMALKLKGLKAKKYKIEIKEIK